jgi:hypothetical protein
VARFNAGDKIVCHIKNNKIVNIYEEVWDINKVFEIIAVYDNGYCIYVPISFYLEEVFELTISNHRKFNANKKFIGSKVVKIDDHRIFAIHSKIDGMCCNRCEEFYQMAEPNCEDGTMLCWLCRAYKYR